MPDETNEDLPEGNSTVGHNLARLLQAWNTVVQSGSTRDLGATLDEDVLWQGALPDSVSRGREAVLAVLEDNEPPRLQHIEVREIGDRVLLTMEGPDFPVTKGHLAGIRVIVFTFRDGRVTRMETIGKVGANAL